MYEDELYLIVSHTNEVDRNRIYTGLHLWTWGNNYQWNFFDRPGYTETKRKGVVPSPRPRFYRTHRGAQRTMGAQRAQWPISTYWANARVVKWGELWTPDGQVRVEAFTCGEGGPSPLNSGG